MTDTDKYLHRGHRSRMRRRFVENGARSLESHELLEMLLFHVIPCKNTNPVSKKLLLRFGSLDGVFSAEREQLLGVEGVGLAVANFIVAVGELMSADKSGKEKSATICLYSNEIVGNFLVEYYSKLPKKPSVVMLALDNRMNLIGAKVICEAKYDTAAIRAKPFVDYAVSTNAAVAIVAHNHPYGPLFQSVGDLQTDRLLQSALASINVSLLESYVICGDSYISSMLSNRFMLFRAPERDDFAGGAAESSAYGTELEVALCCLLSYAIKEPRRAVVELSRRYCDFASLVTAEIADMSKIESVGSAGAMLLSLFFALNSRKETEKFKLGARHSEEEIISYLKALLMPMSNETLYALLFDAKGRVISSEYMGEGTVNSTAVIPRKILEAAMRKNASSLVLAHNHPSGEAVPSAADIVTTNQIKDMLATVNISLDGHYVFACDEYTKI